MEYYPHVEAFFLVRKKQQQNPLHKSYLLFKGQAKAHDREFPYIQLFITRCTEMFSVSRKIEELSAFQTLNT